MWSCLTSANGVPRRDSHAEVAGHGDDLTLHVTKDNVPAALVNAERRLACGARVGVGRRNDVCGRVADSQVQDFALLNDGVEGVHDLLNAGGPVPPVDVQDVDPVGLELLQRVTEGDVEGASVVAGRVEGAETFAFPVADVVGGELGGDDHLVSVLKKLKSVNGLKREVSNIHLLPRSFIHSPIQVSDSSSW
jgi:hypothetical protein